MDDKSEIELEIFNEMIELLVNIGNEKNIHQVYDAIDYIEKVKNVYFD